MRCLHLKKPQRFCRRERSDKAIRWHYTVRSACHEVIVLDTRTWRGYPIAGKTTDPPMLLCPSAFQQQLQEPLSTPSTHSTAQVAQVSGTCAQSDYRTFIVAPTNVFGMRMLDWIQRWHLERRKTFTADVGDSWNFHSQALATLLITFFQHRKKVVVLSGDIHCSSVIHVDYKDLATGDCSNLVQFTSSAMKNEEGYHADTTHSAQRLAAAGKPPTVDRLALSTRYEGSLWPNASACSRLAYRYEVAEAPTGTVC